MTEFEIQRAVFMHYAARGNPESFGFAVPNGGYRRPIEAARLKASGVIAGVPDTVWIKGGRAYFLELKAARGRLSERQAAIIETLERCGAICEVVYGLDHALKVLEGWGLLAGRAA